MTWRIRIGVERGLPPGRLRLDDAGDLAASVFNAVAKIIHLNLGNSKFSNVGALAKGLADIEVTDITAGSGVLDCIVEEVADAPTNPPAVVALWDLMRGLKYFELTGQWPAYLSSQLRKDLGKALPPLVDAEHEAFIQIQRNGWSRDIVIKPTTREALIKPDEYEPEAEIEILGKMFELNVHALHFKLLVGERKVNVHFDEELLNKVDNLRWKRVRVRGTPTGPRVQSVELLRSIELAPDEEIDHMRTAADPEAPEADEFLVFVEARVRELRGLRADWNSYGAPALDAKVLDSVAPFLRQARDLLKDYDLVLPPPFIAPTSAGHVQLEWEIENRYLELEFASEDEHHFLKEWEAQSREGRADKWTGLNLIRWVVGGEPE